MDKELDYATILIFQKNENINPKMYILFGEKNEHVDKILWHEKRNSEEIFYLDPKYDIPIIIDLEPVVERNGAKYRTRLILDSIYVVPYTSTVFIPTSQREERKINLELPNKTTITLSRKNTYKFIIDFEEVQQNK